MFGLSPLSASHPLGFQPKWVRPSTGSYPRFSLPMDSSPGFASTACDSKRHLKGSLSLRLGSNLNLAAYRNSLAHSTKGTPSLRKVAPTACGRTVSGTVSLPSRGAFHLSLTVLVRYRSQESVQPWRVVPPASNRVSRARPYSGAARAQGLGLRLRGCYPLRPAFPCRFGCSVLCDCARGVRARGRCDPTTPMRQRLAAYTRMGLGWCAFARRYSRNLG